MASKGFQLLNTDGVAAGTRRAPVDHGTFPTLDEALGCMAFDRLTSWEVWNLDTNTVAAHRTPAAPPAPTVREVLRDVGALRTGALQFGVVVVPEATGGNTAADQARDAFVFLCATLAEAWRLRDACVALGETMPDEPAVKVMDDPRGAYWLADDDGTAIIEWVGWDQMPAGGLRLVETVQPAEGPADA